MNSWMKLGGSVVLATLLLSGCGDSNSNENATTKTVEDTQSGTETQSNATQKAQTQKDAAELYVRINNKGEFSALNKIKWANGDFDDEPSKFVKEMVATGLTDGDITQAEADKILASDLNQFYMDLITGASTSSESQSKQRNFLTDAIDKLTGKTKDALNDLLATNAGQDVTGAAFKLVMKSDGLTVFMIDQARNSRTITDVMIDSLGDQSNWNGITPKMYPMLRESKEFGEKFAALAYEMNPETKDGAPAMGRFFFSMVDRGMYDALGDAMILSDDNAVHDDSVEMSTTGYMGALMIRHAKQFFIAPGTGVQADLSTASGENYGSTDAFSNLMFDTGAPVTVDNNGTVSGHGDASELQNEKFFYAMFRTPSSTADFISAMNAIEDEDTVVMFMDEIFLGQSTDANMSADTIQGYYNIIAVAGGMNEGVEKYGIDSYYSNFLGFYNLVPAEKFPAYGLAFMNAGFHYMGINDIDIWGGVSDAAKSYYDDAVAYVTGDTNTTETNATSVAQAPSFRANGDGTFSTSWSSEVWACTSKAYDTISFWDSIYNWGSSLVNGDNNNTVADTNTTEDIGAVDTFSTCLHDSIELAVREDMVNDSKNDGNESTDITIEDANFTLPSFSDITFKYVYTGVYDRAVSRVGLYYDETLGDISAWWSDFSLIDSATGAYEYTKGFVWNSENSRWATSEERWAYFPDWLANTQWLDLKEYYASGTSTLTIDFDSGVVDFYIISQDANLTETVAGLSDTMTRVDNADVPLSVQKDLNMDNLTDDEITSYYVYTIQIADTTGLDEILTALEDYISGFGVDVTAAGTDSNATTDTNTTADTNATN